MTKKPRFWLTYFATAAVLIAIGLIWGAHNSKFQNREGGLTVYTNAALRMAQNQEIFIRHDPEGAFTYPPFFALVFVPLTLLPQSVWPGVFQALNLLVAQAAVTTVLMVLYPYTYGIGLSLVRRCGWVALVLILSLRHLLSPLGGEYHDLILFGLVLLAVVAASRLKWLLAGFFAGLASACKATPLLFLPVLLWQRRWLAAGILVFTVVGATLLPDLIFPRSDGRLWSQAWYQTFLTDLKVGTPPPEQGWTAWDKLNHNLSGTIYRLSAPPPPATSSTSNPDVRLWNPSTQTLRLVTTLAQMLVLAFVLWVTREKWSRNLTPDQASLQHFGEGGVIICAMLLLSPMSGKAHFCALLVPISFCAFDFIYRERSAITGVSLLLLTIVAFTGKDLIGKQMSDLFNAWGAVMWCTLTLLFACGWTLWRRSTLLAIHPDNGNEMVEESSTSH